MYPNFGMCLQDKVEQCSRNHDKNKVIQRELSRTKMIEPGAVSKFTFLLFLFLSLNTCWAQSQQGESNVADERCFLQAGGSTASFFVKEDLAVGSLVGQLRIKGDVGENINLTLTPSDAPIRIEKQDLILTQPLDKEGILGPSSISVDVTCHRMATFDPGLIFFY